MSRDVGQRITDVLVAVERRHRYVAALDGDGDIVDMAEDAIERNLQIIGEAVNHLPTEITDAHPEIGWPQIRGFRNILVHQYFGVDVGYFDRSLNAYRREGEPCDRCGAPLRRDTFMNRSSYWRPACQPRPRNGRW